MRVPIQLHDALVVSFENWQQSVAHDDALLLTAHPHLDLLAWHYLFKQTLEEFSLGIVIASDQVYSAMQRMHDLTGMSGIDAAEHVPDDKDVITFADTCVPAADHLRFHLVDVFKRAPVKRDHIPVTKMQVRNKEYFSHITPSQRCSPAANRCPGTRLYFRFPSSS